jgi:hypothetical protein
MNQKQFIYDLVEELKDEFSLEKKLKVNLVIFTNQQRTVVRHECSFIESQIFYFSIYYSITGDFYFFEGCVPWGGFGDRYFYMLDEEFVPGGIKRELKEVARTLKGKIIRLEEDSQADMKLLG